MSMKCFGAFLVWSVAMAGSAVSEELQVEPVSLDIALKLVCQPVPENQDPFAGCQSTRRIRVISRRDFSKGYTYQDQDADAWRGLLNDKNASIYGRMCAAHFLAPRDETAREFLFDCAESIEPRHRLNAANVLINLHYDIEDQPDWIMPRLSALALEGKFDPLEEPFDPSRRWPEHDKDDLHHNLYFRFSYRLTFWKDSRAVDVLIRCCEKGIAVEHAAQSLKSIGDKRAVPSLLSWFQTRRYPQDDVIEALSNFGTKEIVPELRTRLFVKIAPGEPSIGSAGTMVLALKDLSAKEAIPDIERYLAEYRDRASAEALASTDPFAPAPGGRAPTPAPASGQNFPTVSAKTDTTELACKRALAVLKDADPVASLLQMLSSEDDDFRKGDLIADLVRLSDERVEKRLVEVAQTDLNLNVRWRALWGLARMKTQSSLLLVVSHLDFKFPPLKEGLPKGTRHQTDDEATAFMREKIVDMLKQTTGQKFGQDRAAWEKWIQEEFPKSVSAKQ